MGQTFDAITRTSPFRYLTTPRGGTAAAVANCGPREWISDRRGYR